MYTVYAHIDPEGKRYYGATKQKVNNRWRNGRGYKNQKFCDAIEKYGWDNIKHIIIAKGLTEEEAYWLEEELIKVFDTTNPDKGYNIEKGGKYGADGVKRSEDTRKKMSDSSTKYWKGKHFSYDHIDKISKANGKSVICLITRRIFYSAHEGAKYYSIARCSITKCCQGKRKSAGKLNGQKLVWRYLVWKHNKKFRIVKESR